jgi:hypothetical protein
VAGSCEYDDDPSGSGATELVSLRMWSSTCSSEIRVLLITVL